VPRDPFQSFQERLQKAVSALSGDIELDRQEVSFPAYRSGSLQRVTIQTNAYRQLQRYLLGRIGAQSREVPYSDRYLRWRQKVGLPGKTWTLVKTGLLYSTLRYVIKKGELFAEFSDERKEAVRGLNETVRFKVLRPSEDEVKDMATEIAKKRLANFMKALQKKDNYGN
jgi:hypothetical protein